MQIRASLYFLKDNKTIDYLPDETSIAAFSERVSGMIGSVCAEEFVAKPSFMGCRGAITGICARLGRRAWSEWFLMCKGGTRDGALILH